MGDMIDIAMKLRDEQDSVAAALDVEGGFPHDSYDRMREAGYLRAPVPGELGGLGADMVEVAGAQRALGWGCASTALAVNMHLFQVGGAAEAWRATGKNEAALRRVADEGVVLGSTGAEAIVAGAWDTPTTAVPDGDHYVVSGRKFFCSQADGMDLVRVNARDAQTGEILVLAVPARATGVTVVPTWDTMGMRGTASHDLVLDEVRVPATAVGVRLPASGPAWDPRFATVIRWFLAGVSGVYLGIADRARDVAHAGLDGGGNSTSRAPALTDTLVGQLETAHLRASAVFEVGVPQVASADDPVTGMVRAIATKEEVTTACVEVVDRAVDLVGGRSYFRRSVLERLARDVRAARYHPPSAPVSHEMIGIGTRRG